MKNIIFKIISVTLSAVTVITLLLSVTLFVSWQNSDEYVKFDRNKLDKVYGCSTFLDNDGQVLCEPTNYGTKKQIPLAALPDYVYMAFVAVEDKRFFTHNGVDFLRVGSAALHNVLSGGKKEGASTITQQLVKNTHLSGAKTYKRKINEMLLATELEKNYTKEEILEMYLNTIYFGRNAYGIETAANVYFGKSASDLSVEEAAVLAAMIKAPNVYAPDKNADKCQQRRNAVLKLMYEQGIIQEKTYREAKQKAVSFVEYTTPNKDYAYFALKEAAKVLNMTEKQVMQGGFVVETYCKAGLQKQLSKNVEGDMTKQTDGTLSDLCLAICDNKGRMEACCLRGEGVTKRQVGSTLKPIAVYTPAFCERQICPASPLLDEKTNFNGYCPTNVGGYKGWTTVTNAVLTSSNVGAVKTLNALTLQTANKYLTKFGYVGNDLSLALGNVDGGMDEIDLLHCYTALSNKGNASEIKFVKSISNEYGALYKNKDKFTNVFDEASTYLMTDLLVKNARIGTARKIYNDKIEVAAKTGTVGNKQGNSDAFTVAYTSKNVLVCHYYGQLSNDTNGGGAPCKMLKKVLSEMHAENTAKFAKPKNVEYVPVDQRALFLQQQILFSKTGELYPFVDKEKFVCFD